MKAHPVLTRMQDAYQTRYDGPNIPMAAKGLTSYRYKERLGWIMIGATDHADALSEAGRSLERGAKPEQALLQVWNGMSYVWAYPEIVTKNA